MQEVAGNHGVAIWGRTEAGFATDPIMVEMDLIFVTTRIQVQMDTYPRWYMPRPDILIIALSCIVANTCTRCKQAQAVILVPRIKSCPFPLCLLSLKQ